MQGENIKDDRTIDARSRGPAGEEQSLERKRSSSCDSCSTTDLENQRKKGKRTELLTAGLATVATIHAESLSPAALVGVENRLMALSEAVAARFFLQGAETVRATGMTLA